MFERRHSARGGVTRRALGGVYLALWFALTPSSVPDWRLDPGIRTVAVLPVGEPMRAITHRD